MTAGARVSALLSLSLAAGVTAAGPMDVAQDEARAAWRYRRSVTAKGDCFAAVSVPPELTGRAEADLVDLRLVSPDGTEVPYVVERRLERDLGMEWRAALIDTAQERKRQTVWTLDLGEPRTFDALALDVPGEDFAKRLRVEASEDRRVWHAALEEAGIFDRLWDSRVHLTRIELGQPVTARYLRLTADDRYSPAITLTGATAVASRRRGEETWSRAAEVTPLSRDAVSRYRVELPDGLRFERLRLAAEDRAFHRRVVLLEARDVNGRRQEQTLADAWLFRLDLGDRGAALESLKLNVGPQTGGELILEIYDGDSPPLRALRLTAEGVVERLLFPASGSSLLLYYGNPRARAPLYDLASLSSEVARRLEQGSCLTQAELGPEAPNPRFKPAPPLPFAPLFGASLDVSRWKTVRLIQVNAGEDVYTLTLDPADLAAVRQDLGDLRLVDDQGRQVPFLLETNAAEARVPLTVERLARPEIAGGRNGAESRYLLRLPAATSSRPNALPLHALSLSFAEPFFERRALLSEGEAAPGRRGEGHVLFSGSLAHGAGDKSPLVLSLDESRLAELRLAVDEGDNAPLTLQRAEAAVRVPRVAFKAGSGTFRLLLGNREAEPPRYDLAALRSEVLCYSARVVQAGPAQANPAFRRGVAELVGEAQPTALLWVVLVVAVAALLFLTLRILKSAGAEEPKNGPPSA